MRIRCYPEGDDTTAATYNPELVPGQACDRLATTVRFYMRERHSDEVGQINIVVEPVDDEARALPGWQSDVDGPFRLFVVQARVEWTAREVVTFNPNAATAKGVAT